MSDSVRARAGRIRAKTVERETKPSAAAPDPSIRHRVEPDAMSRERTASPRTPAAAVMHKARRLLGRVRAKVIFSGCQGGGGLCATGPVSVRVRGRAALGMRITFLGGMVPSEISVDKGARLSIGDETIFNYGVSIAARSAVTIGRRCMFGSFVRLSDESIGQLAPVILGDDVWIAHGAIIGPGVTIGDGSVVSAGSVVTTDVPPHSLAIGNPARVMSLGLTVKG